MNTVTELPKLKTIPLVEMFGPTIQGEGAVIGFPTYFMRFGLCDYKCTMCDSMHAVDPFQVKANAKRLTEAQIAEEFFQLHSQKPNSTRWVTYSGGNPCIHDLTILTNTLKAAGYKIAVETQGTKVPHWLADVDILTVSPKGPGMGQEIDMDELDNFMMACDLMAVRRLNMKVVIFDQRDIEFAAMIYERYKDYIYKPLMPEFYLSLGNPFPPGHPNLIRWQQEMGEEDFKRFGHLRHMDVLVTQYKQLWEDLQNHPVLGGMRFLPQWHTFPWGNEKGK